MASGEIQWQIAWSACADGVAIDSPTYSGTVKSGDLNIPATAKSSIHSTLTIPGTNIGQEDEVGIILKRIAIDDGNNPTADPGILCVRVEAINNKLGEEL